MVNSVPGFLFGASLRFLNRVILGLLLVTCTITHYRNGVAPVVNGHSAFAVQVPRQIALHELRTFQLRSCHAGVSSSPLNFRENHLDQGKWFVSWRRRTRKIQQQEQVMMRSTRRDDRDGSESNFDSNDPFVVLGIDPAKYSQQIGKKEIKRAYKRLALRYHPDVVTDKNSTPQEKKFASDRFAKINWAYESLSGKRKDDRGTATGKTRSSTSSSQSGDVWTPPHRRSGTSRSSTSSSSSSSGDYRSTDWRDYIPNYGDDEYDTGGDSLGAIFSDLIKEVSSSSSSTGGPGIFRDFIEFLETNIEGYAPGGGSSGRTGTSGDNAELLILLQTGSLQDVGDEMDETQLVVQQLSSKITSIDEEILMLQADLKLAVRFSEKITIEERLAELQARKKVVNGYLKRGQKRLVSLQTRYKELIVQGKNNPSSDRGRSYNSQDPSSSPSSSANSSSSSSQGSAGRTDKDEAWQQDGFGSFGRGRGRSQRQRSQQRDYSNAAASSTTSASSYSSSSSSSRSHETRSASSSDAKSSFSSKTQSQTYDPPHRRISSSSRMDDDKRRLREIKVDEEFEKLKRDLGL